MENCQPTNFSNYRPTLSGQPLPEGKHTVSEQTNGGYLQNQPSLFSGGGTYNTSAQQIKREPMDTTTPSFITKQEPVKTIKEEFQSKIKDESKHYIKVEPTTLTKDDKCIITVSVRGQGNQTKCLQIERTASLDEFISEVNNLFGFGRNPGNTYILFNGKQLSRGTQTVEEARIQNKSSVELCVRTLGGRDA